MSHVHEIEEPFSTMSSEEEYYDAKEEEEEEKEEKTPKEPIKKQPEEPRLEESLTLIVPPGRLGLAIEKVRGELVVAHVQAPGHGFEVDDVIRSWSSLPEPDQCPWTLLPQIVLHPDQTLDQWEEWIQDTRDLVRSFQVQRGGRRREEEEPTEATNNEKHEPEENRAEEMDEASKEVAEKMKDKNEEKNKGKCGSTKKKKKRKKLKRKRLVAFVLQHPHNHDLDNPPELPPLGQLCPHQCHYMTQRAETLSMVADKVGCTWKTLSQVGENRLRYGKNLRGATAFQSGTLIRLDPQNMSPWLCQKLAEKHNPDEQLEEQDICCVVCRGSQDADELVLCDGCNTAQHVQCSPDLTSVPKGAWFCADCLEILCARKEHYDGKEERTLRASTPPLPPLQIDVELVQRAQHRLVTTLQLLRDQAYRSMKERQRAEALATKERIQVLIDILPEKSRIKKAAKAKLEKEKYRLLRKHGVREYQGELERFVQGHADSSISVYDDVFIVTVDARHYRYEEVRTMIVQVLEELQPHIQAKERVFRERDALAKELVKLKRKEEELPEAERTEARILQNKYSRETKLMGFCRVTCEEDVGIMTSLLKTHGLIYTVPMVDNVNETAAKSATEDDFSIEVDGDYAVFGIEDLFDTERDDSLSLGETDVRNAQRKLLSILLEDPRNASILASPPVIPSSVQLRGRGSIEESATTVASKCFDLSELVRDCTCDLELCKAPTPPKLAARGLQLRDHQQVSLQWMLDKEENPTGLGVAGELWTRLQFLDSSGSYYYCELTGSFVFDIFNFKADTNQKDAAENFGSFPVGGILGDEMGLGKTIVSLALVVANPPPKYNRVLPREHQFEGKIDNENYTTPPSVKGCTSSSAKTILLSNGTLVVAPVTLCSQWKAEIQKFAPWMSVIAIHTGEIVALQDLASADIVIASTATLQNSNPAARTLKNSLKRIHFHRLIVDEAHCNQQGEKTQASFGSLSASSRFCVTGTPIGNSLDDLGGQLRFLRVPQFCRPNFWKNNICHSYAKRDEEALNVLRSLLSRLIVRHSKAQITAAGKALLELPPRTVETVLLQFGSTQERKIYDIIESLSMSRFEELRSNDGVLSGYSELQGLCYAARQACCHASLIELWKLHSMFSAIERNRKTEVQRKYGAYKEGTIIPDGSKDRDDVLEEAVLKARYSAKGRTRELILKFHDGGIHVVDCAICLEPITEQEGAVTPCGHCFCRECVMNCMKTVSTRVRKEEATGNCPNCRERIRQTELTFLGEASDAGQKKSPVKKKREPVKPASMSIVGTVIQQMNGFQMVSKDIGIDADATSSTERVSSFELSDEDRLYQRGHFPLLSAVLNDHEKCSSQIGSKINQLLAEVKNMITKDPTSKCVVFSQYLEVLNIAAEELFARGVKVVRVDGSMKQYERADALMEFSSNPETKVFLLSMKAGASGLNLTAANYCFIMDTSQHSASEEQAIDRIHRIGQTREVIVKRFVMTGTIEERILHSRRQLTNSGIEVTLARVEESPTKRPRHTHTETSVVEDASLEHQRYVEAWFGQSIKLKSEVSNGETAKNS